MMISRLWFLFWLFRVTESSTIGYSGTLTNDLKIQTDKPYTISTWTVPQTLSYFYDYSPKSNETGAILIPMEGVYFLGTEIKIKSKDAVKLEIKFADNALTDSIYCQNVYQLQADDTQTISLSCFARFISRTNLALRITTLQPVEAEVLKGSTLCVQNVGMIGHLTSFILPLRDATVVGNRATIPIQMNIREYKYYNSFSDMSNLADIAVPCSGVYIISLNAHIAVNEKSTFTLSVGKTVLLQTSNIKTSESTLTLLQSLDLKKGDKVTIMSKDIKFLKGSAYSLVRLDTPDKVQGLFMPVNDIIYRDRDKLYRVPFNLTNPDRPYFMKNSIMVNSVNRDDTVMKIRSEGIYLISIRIEAESNEANQQKLYLRVRGENSLTTISRSGTKEKSRYFILSGFLRLKDYDEVSVLIEKSQGFKVLPNSHLSLTKIQPKTVVSTAEIPPTSQSVIRCDKKKWKVLSGFESRNQHDLNAFQHSDKYVIPTAGIYLVLAEVSVKTSGAPNLQNVYLALSRKNTQGTSKHLIRSIATVTKKPRILSIHHVLKFERDDSLTLEMTCNKSIEFTHKTKLDVLYLKNYEDLTYLGLTKSEDKVTSNPPEVYLPEYKQLKVSANGIYFVTVTRKIKYQNLNSNSAKVVMYVYAENGDKTPNIRWLRTIDYFDKVEMGEDGHVTLHVSGFLKIKQNQAIEVKIEHLDTEVLIVTLTENIGLVALDDAPSSQYRFKSVTDTKSQFMLNQDNKMQESIENFNSFSIIYKSDDFLKKGRSSFIVERPMFVLYDCAVELRNALGEFKIELKIYPRFYVEGMTQLSNNIVIQEKQNVMIKVVGILELKQSDLVGLVITGMTNDYVQSYYRSWSVIELTVPSAKRHHVQLIKTSSISPRAAVGSLQAVYPGNAESNLPRSIQLVTSASRSPINNLPIWMNTFKLTANPNTHIFQKTYVENINVNLKDSKSFYKNSYVSKYGVSSFIQIKSDTSLVDVIVYLKKKNKSHVVFSSPLVDKTVILFLCLSPTDEIGIKSNLQPPSSNNNSSTKDATKDSKNSQITIAVVPINFAAKINGFSGVILSENKNENLVGNTSRVSNWFSNDSPFFHKAPRLIPVEGVFILESSGFYFVSVNILIKRPSKRCQLVIAADELTLFAQDTSRSVISFTDTIWLQKDLFLQVQVKCQNEKDRKEVVVGKHSTMALFLIESQPSFTSLCSTKKLKVLSNIRNKSLNVAYGRTIELKCFDKSSMMGDFMWKRDDKVVYAIKGVREATLKLNSLTPKENGRYYCEMKRGYATEKMDPIGIMVIDPRPKLSISNNTVFIGENYIANNLLAWIKVEARNVQTNQFAKVRFSIIKGNDDQNFYTDPPVSNSHISLLFRRPFDYEEKNKYELTINAENLEYNEDGGANANISMFIYVLNNNEHKPEFTTTKTKFSLLENMGVGTPIFRFKAGDLDDDSIRYSLADTLQSSLFRIDDVTGEMTVAGDIDYERTSELFPIVCASDSLYRECINIKIEVLNENDNAPYFTQLNYTVNITKTALPETTVLKLRAKDLDDKGNKNLSFSITNGNEEKYFAIKGNEIKLIKDYEGPTRMFKMGIIVTDGVFESLKRATVKINFIGDDPIPKFSQSVYQLYVPENTFVGNKVEQLNVTYKGQLGGKSAAKIVYKLKNLKSATKDYFGIDSQANIYIKEELDYEKSKTIILLVSSCVRVRKKERCGICHVTVHVLDINDNKPEFQELVYKTSISEHLANKTRFFQVKATDADSEGENSRIIYFLKDTFDLFDIDNDTGRLFTSRDITPDDGTYFELSIGARDAGTPTQISSTYCKVKIDILLSNPVKIMASKTEGILGLKNWEFWILPCLGTVVLLLILVVATICWKYRRSRRRFHEYVIEQPTVQDSNRNSFLTYLTKPVSSQEETMYLSCGSLPSAYNSEKDLSNEPAAGTTSRKEKSSSVVFTENGYSTFANEADDESLDKNATNV